MSTTMTNTTFASSQQSAASRRVVVTGMGWVTPLGHDVNSVWQRLMNSESGMGPITRFDARTFPTTFAAQVKDYDIARFVKDASVHASAGLNSQFALGAACQAWAQSGLDRCATLNKKRVGLYLGAGEGVVDFENYAASNLAGWDEATQKLGGVKWAYF
ncbi:MAG: beta-ketoacyl-[acyl-carrier-protein] synthase II, partial [Planctomycetota bacterium]